MKGQKAFALFRAPTLARLVSFCACMVQTGVVGAAPPSDADAAGIVHSASVAPAAPKPLVKPFIKLAIPTAPSESSGTAQCSLDMVDGGPAHAAMVIDHRVPVTFVGWAADEASGVPPHIVFLLIGKQTFGIAGVAGLPRLDVANAKHNPAFALSGYSISGDPSVIPQGEYHLALIERFGTTDQLCLINRTIAVK